MARRADLSIDTELKISLSVMPSSSLEEQTFYAKVHIGAFGSCRNSHEKFHAHLGHEQGAWEFTLIPALFIKLKQNVLT